MTAGGWRKIPCAYYPQYTTSAVNEECDGYQYYCLVRDPSLPEGLQTEIVTLHLGAAPIIPETGDHRMPLLYAAMIFIGGAGVLLSRKRGNQV